MQTIIWDSFTSSYSGILPGHIARIIFARSSKEIAMILVFSVRLFFEYCNDNIALFYAHKDTKPTVCIVVYHCFGIYLVYNLSKPTTFGAVVIMSQG